MSGNRLARPPFLITDIPTNYRYGVPGTGEIDFSGIDKPFDSTTRYKSGGGNVPRVDVASVCTVPNSFREAGYHHGLVMAVRRYSNNLQQVETCSLFIHRNEGAVANYSSTKNWAIVNDAVVGISQGNFGEAITRCRLFAQRQGEYVYALFDAEIEAGGPRIGYKFNHSGFATVWYSDRVGLGSGGYTNPVLDYDGQYHVSDDETPFIWTVTSYGVADYDGLRLGQNTGVWVLGFADDGSEVGHYQYIGDFRDNDGNVVAAGSGYNVSGQSGAFYQKHKIPDGQWGHGPLLVHPWVEGAYGAPELWWFIMQFDNHGQTTGQYKVYRSQWKKGAYVRYDNPNPGGPVNGYTFMQAPIVITDDDTFTAHGSKYPKLNPEGYGFETEWFDNSHLVGTINLGFPTFNPQGTAVAAAQNLAIRVANNGFYFRPSHFRVCRDRKRIGLLHFALTGFQEGNFTTQPTYDVYFASSGDDGATYGRWQAVTPGPHNFGSTTSTDVISGIVNFDRPDLLNLYDGHTVMPVGYNYDHELIIHHGDSTSSEFAADSGSRAALIVVDYVASGVGAADVSPTVFKRGELKRASWL